MVLTGKIGGVVTECDCGGIAHVAQLVEHVLGKDEVTSSILVIGSRLRAPAVPSERVWQAGS